MRFELRDVTDIIFAPVGDMSFYLLIDHTNNVGTYVTSIHDVEDIERLIVEDNWKLSVLCEVEYAQSIDLGMFNTFDEIHAMIEFKSLLS